MTDLPPVIALDITADDIARGRPCSTLACPIALALYRAGYRHVDVAEDETVVYANDLRDCAAYEPDDAAVAFIEAFDAAKHATDQERAARITACFPPPYRVTLVRT